MFHGLSRIISGGLEVSEDFVPEVHPVKSEASERVEDVQVLVEVRHWENAVYH